MGETRRGRRRRYAPHMSRVLIWAALLVLGACGYQPVAFTGIDCGTTVEGLDGAYDSKARDCVWSAYSRGGCRAMASDKHDHRGSSDSPDPAVRLGSRSRHHPKCHCGYLLRPSRPSYVDVALRDDDQDALCD